MKPWRNAADFHPAKRYIDTQAQMGRAGADNLHGSFQLQPNRLLSAMGAFARFDHIRRIDGTIEQDRNERAGNVSHLTG